MLSTEILMQPRFKVIASFPYSANPIGQILINDGGWVDGLYIPSYDEWEKKPTQILHRLSFQVLEQFPAIFQRLQWWEDRAVEDLPEYLTMSGRTRKVWKVDRWEDTQRYGLLAYSDGERTPHYLDADKSVQYSPATLQEYEAYKNRSKPPNMDNLTTEQIYTAANDYVRPRFNSDSQQFQVAYNAFLAGVAFARQNTEIKKGDRLKCVSAKSVSLTYGRYYTALCDEYNIGTGSIWVDILDDDGIRDSEPISVFETAIK